MRVTIVEYENATRNQTLADSTRGVVEQTSLTSAATSTQSAAFNAASTYVVVTTDTAIHVRCGGTDPTATTDSQLVPEGTSHAWAVKGGDKLAVLTA